jgi:hypothetical protein
MFSGTRRRACIAIVSAVLLAGGCGVPRARKAGVAKAEEIRRLLNAEKYADVHASASKQFRQAITEQQWGAFCAETRQKLGKWKGATLKDTNVLLVGTGGYMTNVIYTTEFENGRATETFSFMVNITTADLLGYNIDSPLMPGGRVIALR